MAKQWTSINRAVFSLWVAGGLGKGGLRSRGAMRGPGVAQEGEMKEGNGLGRGQCNAVLFIFLRPASALASLRRRLSEKREEGEGFEKLGARLSVATLPAAPLRSSFRRGPLPHFPKERNTYMKGTERSCQRPPDCLSTQAFFAARRKTCHIAALSKGAKAGGVQHSSPVIYLTVAPFPLTAMQMKQL